MWSAVLITVSALLCGLSEAAIFKRVCYVSNWSQYRPLDGMFKPPNIDPTLCSHIVYAFATLDNNNNLGPFEWNDDGAGGLYEQLNSFKTSYPTLKTLIAVGGWNFGMDKLVIMLSSAVNRQKFVDQSVAYCRQRNFDGLDLDFEYPADRGSPPEDKQNFVLLIQSLRAAFNADAARTGKPVLLLTAATAAGKSNIDSGYDVPAITESLDWINLMAYDLNGAWDNQTGINAPLYPRFDELGSDRKNLNLDFAAEYWVSLGCPKEKLVLGVAVYGRCFTLKNAGVNGLGVPVIGPCENGTYTREAGFLSYYEICDLIKRPGAVTIYDYEHQAPYTYVGDQWVGYDNVASLTAKAKYMMSGGYAGVMVWNIDLDDFTGSHCNAGKYPLLKTLNNVIAAGIVDTTTTAAKTTTTTTTTTTTAPEATTTTTRAPAATTTTTTTTTPPEVTTTTTTRAPTITATTTAATAPPEVTTTRTTGAPTTTTTAATPPPEVTTTRTTGASITATTTGPIVQTTTTAATDVCVGNPTGPYTNPDSCTSFYNCAGNGVGTLSKCAPSLYFNPVNQVCDWGFQLSEERQKECGLLQ